MNSARAITVLGKHNLLQAGPDALAAARTGALLEEILYSSSLFRHGADLFAVLRDEGAKQLLITGSSADPGRDFRGRTETKLGVTWKVCPFSTENIAALRHTFPWTAPVSLAEHKTTFGCGDRLGRATPGHLNAARKFKVAPVLAQQSMRELTLTRRTFQNVLDDVSGLVFQSGYTLGFGADADHLKTMEHIGLALDIGMTMITLDLSEVMRPEAASFSRAAIQADFERLPADWQQIIRTRYAGQSWRLQSAAGSTEVGLTEEDALRCAVMYGPALDFAGRVYALLVQKRGVGHFDLELSIDETSTPTLPAHHLFLIRELIRREVKVVSLAPRFIGEFQKGIDYAGDLAEFTRQFTAHAIIAQTHGDYKISVHSGSDKFSIFPIVGRVTGGRFHEKTAGTSWLEAVRLIALQAPRLYRKMHRIALDRLPDALKLYHITPALDQIPDLALLKEEDLPGLMDLAPARQVLHVAYGFILENPEIRYEFFQVLDQFEAEHYRLIERHFTRHMERLGIPPVAS